MVKVVRLRRRGTCGLETVRMRQGLDVSSADGLIKIRREQRGGDGDAGGASGAKVEKGEQ